MQENPYKLAATRARRELETARQDRKELDLRISQLEAAIMQLDALIASSRPVPISLFAEEPAPLDEDRGFPMSMPLWRAIIAALSGRKSNFTVPDALVALERAGRFINSPNKKSIIRNALKQRPDKFQRLSVPGHYCVREDEHGAEQEQEERMNA